MSRKQLSWKPKHRNCVKIIQPNTASIAQKKVKKPKSQWISTTDLRLKTIKEFVNFFTLKYHTKQQIENCDIYIQHLLTKLSHHQNYDISILLNHQNKNLLIFFLKNSEPKLHKFYTAETLKSNFSALSHCIYNIGTSCKHNYKTDKYHKHLLSKWMNTIKLLIKYNSNPLQCIHCQQILNVYDQYCYCTNVSAHNSSNNKMHRTPFKELFKYLRHDLISTAKQSKKHRSQNIAIVHEALYQLLEWILNEYNIYLPLIRLTFCRIFLGLTPPYGDYENKVMENGGFHTVLPTFPSYDILYNLLSITRVVPFTFVTRRQASKNEHIYNSNELHYLLTSNHGMKLWQDCNVYQFIKECPQKAFEIAIKHTHNNTLSAFANYREYEKELGFGSFYEEIAQYLAYCEPVFVKELCQTAAQFTMRSCGASRNLKSKRNDFWWKTNETQVTTAPTSAKHWFMLCEDESTSHRIKMLQTFCLQNPYKKGIIYCNRKYDAGIIHSALFELKVFNPWKLNTRYKYNKGTLCHFDYVIICENCYEYNREFHEYGNECNVIIDFESDSLSSYELKMDLVSQYKLQHMVSLIYNTPKQLALYKTIEETHGIHIEELPSDLNEAFSSDYNLLIPKEATPTPTYIEMCAAELQRTLDDYDHNVCGIQDDFPVQWSIALLFTIRSIYYETISNAILCIEPNVSTCIICIILEISYCSKTFYDEYFGGHSFVCNVNHVQKCISVMKQNNILMNRDVTPLKHRTNNHVIASWIDAFKSAKYNHKYFKRVWNESEISKMRTQKITASNVQTKQYYVNIGEEHNKFNVLIDILSQAASENKYRLSIVCEYNQTAEKLRYDLNLNRELAFSFAPSAELQYQQMCSMRAWSHTSLITYYKQHICEWKHEQFDVLILYDVPLEIDDYIAQINGYTFVCSLVTNKELMDQCTTFKDEHKLNLCEIQSKEVLNRMIEQQKRITNDNNRFVDVDSEQYKNATLIDLMQNWIKKKTIVFVRSSQRANSLYLEIKDRMSNDWLICDKHSVTQFQNIPCDEAAVLIVHESYSNPFGVTAIFVVNYDLPPNNNEWIKRMSYGKLCINLLTNDDRCVLERIERFCGVKMEELTYDLLANIFQT